MLRKKSNQVVRSDPAFGWRTDLWICLLLVAAVLVAYLQVRHFDFVSYDDPDYVTENPHVRAGLTWENMGWAFGSSFTGNWFPLTWLSHMLDCQLFGLDSGWHHLTNVWIHIASTLLLFTFLRRATGTRWLSAMVACLFALHPQHVESVAWIAERKDVLSGLCFMLTLWAYAAYVTRPGRGRYALVLGAFCCGLMAKSMLVTVPIVLLLLDQWPLKRGIRIREKLPLVALSMAASIATFLVHRQAGATASFDLVPMTARFENMLVSYAVYILKTFWPADLAVFYPYSRNSLAVPAAFAGIGLAVITVLAVRWFSRRPYLAVGWFWYLVTLLPVIGLVQVGAQARADRYTYIPTIGLSIALVWGAAEVLTSWPRLRIALALALCSACLVLTWLQVRFWRDGASLFQHATDVTSDNWLAHFNLASVMMARGEEREAVTELREGVRLRPGFSFAHSELGRLLAEQNLAEEALQELRIAVRLNPEDADAHFRLGSVLGSLGRVQDAAAEFYQTIRLQPENADAHFNLGIALASQGNVEEAAREFSLAVHLRPNDAYARFGWGIALARLGRMDESVTQFSEAVRLKPDFAEARQALEDAVKAQRQPRK
jgi:protein O-mannosyl-transferase